MRKSISPFVIVVRGIVLALALCAFHLASAGPLPPGWADADIGAPALAGSASYTNGFWTITGGGTDIWGTGDQFNFASTGLNGDGMVIARVLGQTGANAWSKSGAMIRGTTDAGSPEVAVLLTPGNGVTFQYRTNTDSQSVEVNTTGITAPAWVRLSRSGNIFSGSYSKDGVNWTNLGTAQSVPMSSAVLAGLCACPHDNTTNNTATINCALVTPGPQVAEPASITREVFVGETTWPFPKVPVGTNQMLPPMGWSFWNAFAGACDDQLTRQTVSALVSTGLRDAGYSYVLAFDGEWLTTRVANGHDANGNIIIDTSIWPNGIQSVCDNIHTNGFKVAGYSDIGVTGYGNPPEWGSLNYYQQDADQFAKWGWDYLKIDDHGPGDFYAASQAIANNSSGRPMLLSFSTPQTYAFDFGPRICNMWRVGNDITLNLGHVAWSDILREFDSDDTYWSAQAPGTWPDLDMLAVGLYGISDTEGRSHFNMWCIRGAPLIIGTDVRWATNASPAALGPPLSATTLATLSNPEVIAVDQDPLDACGVKVATGVYAKPLGTFTSGNYAVLLLNRTAVTSAITVNWTELGLQPGVATVRDLWAHQSLGTFTNSYTSPGIPSHGSMMLTISGAYDWTQPRVYEAEWAFNTFQGMAHSVSQATGFSNNGYAAGVGLGTSNTLQFNQVAAPANGVYEVDVGYAASAAGSAQLSLNGGAPTTVSFPATGGTTTVGAIPLYLSLQAGTNTLLFSNATATVPNLDNVVVSSNRVGGLTISVMNGQLQLTWTGLAGATSYRVYRGTTSGGESATPIASNLVSPTYTDQGLTNGQTYYYTVTAVNPSFGGEGMPSTEASGTPSQLYPLVAWFRADEISGVTNGGDVVLWPDESGFGNDASQGTAGEQPEYVTGAMNNLPVVRFTSGASTSLSLNRVVQDDFTIMCVFQSTQGIGTGTAFYTGAGLVNAEVAGVENDFGTSLNASGQILAGTGNPDTTLVSAGGFNNGKPQLFTFKRTRSAGAIIIYTNGVQAASTTAGTQSLTSPSQIVIGAQQTLLNYLTGDIAEVKIFAQALSDPERQAEETQLEYKYGIDGLALPALSVAFTNGAVRLSWPASASNFELWGTTNIAAPGSWSQITTATTTVNGQIVATINANGGQQFFRLVAP